MYMLWYYNLSNLNHGMNKKNKNTNKNIVKVKKHSTFFWVFAAFVAALIAAPTAAIVKTSLTDTDPYFYSLVRYSIVLIVCVFILLSKRSQKMHVGKYTILSAITMSISVTTFVVAILVSKASFVSILQLLTPIMFMILSGLMARERFKHQEIIGVTTALIGTALLIIAPLLAGGNAQLTVYPLATVYMIINSIAFALSLVWMKKANEAGDTLILVIFWQALVTVIVSLCLFMTIGDSSMATLNLKLLIAAGYPAIFVAIIVRALDTVVYEQVGSAVVSIMTYLETIVAVYIAIIFLNEVLSIPTIIGGLIVIAGIYIAEKKANHHKYAHHAFRHF